MAAERSDSATLRDVAERAQVSMSTASRALSGRGDLARETRARVAAAAKELEYVRSTESRGRPTVLNPRLIEIVLGTFDDDWTDAITRGARDAAFRLGFDLVLTLERDDPDDDWPARVAVRRPSGVILGIINPTHHQLDELAGLRIPVVLLEPRSDPAGELASVGTTDWQGGYDAGSLLARTPARSFVIVNGVPKYRFGRAREEGFRRAIEDHRPGATITQVNGQWSAMRVTSDLLKPFAGDDFPIGVFACNDEMALAVYQVAAQLGRRIPEDIAVVGFNDDPLAAHASPPLTTLRQPLRAMAERAVELVAELRHHESARYERHELPSQLIVRGSTATAEQPHA